MDYLGTKSWNWKGQPFPNSAGILIQATKPEEYKSSQSSSVRFLKTEIQNDEKSSSSDRFLKTEIQNTEKSSKNEKTQEI